MRLVILTLLALAIAIGGGAWSAAVMLDRFDGAGSLAVGPWRADRLAGSPSADPYSKARVARDGNLTLGLGEGIALRAAVDSQGRELLRQCTYRLSGSVPPARVWTLSAFDPAGRSIAPDEGRPAWLISNDLMRADDNSAIIEVGPQPRPGNWLALSGRGPFILALTLYDTPASTSSGADEIAMPVIERLGCFADG